MALACPSLRFVFLTSNRDECWGGAAHRPALNQTSAAARRGLIGVCVFVCVRSPEFVSVRVPAVLQVLF